MRAKFGELGRGSAFKVGLRPDRWKDFKVGLRAPTRSMCTGAVPIGQRTGPRIQRAVCLVSAHRIDKTTTLIYTFIIPSEARPSEARTCVLLSGRGYASGGS